MDGDQAGRERVAPAWRPVRCTRQPSWSCLQCHGPVTCHALPRAPSGTGSPKRTRPWRAVDQRHVRCGERQVDRRALRKGQPQNTRARLTRKATSNLAE
jgi:hypothetical protein